MATLERGRHAEAPPGQQDEGRGGRGPRGQLNTSDPAVSDVYLLPCHVSRVTRHVSLCCAPVS